MHFKCHFPCLDGNCCVSHTQEKKGVQFEVPRLHALAPPAKGSFSCNEAFNGALPEMIKRQQQHCLVSPWNQF